MIQRGHVLSDRLTFFFLIMQTLQEANQLAKEFIEQLRHVIDDMIVDGYKQFAQGLNCYSLSVIEDKDIAAKNDGDHETILPLSFFNNHITSVNDVAIFFMHQMCHLQCNVLWQRCPIPRSNFQQYEKHFAEELYNQRLFDVIVPCLYDPFCIMYRKYDEVFPYANLDFRNHLNTALSKTVDADIPEYILQAHRELYVSDPFNQNTFNRHMTIFNQALQEGCFGDVIKKYDRTIQN